MAFVTFLFSLFRLAGLSFSTMRLNPDSYTAAISYQNLNDTSVEVCGRIINFDDRSITASTTAYQQWKKNHASNHELVVIGYDNMHHVQTNNHLNAILHAIDYVRDKNSTLAVTRTGWATDVLQLLFGKDLVDGTEKWERTIEQQLDIKIISQEMVTKMIVDPINDYKSISYMSGDEMYYYHSKASLRTIAERRNPILRFLWTHATQNEAVGSEGRHMCSAMFNDIPEKFVVIHSRWMKNNGCLQRLGRQVKRIRNETGIQIDGEGKNVLI